MKEGGKMMRKWLIILLLFPLILLSSCFSNPPEVMIQYESTEGGYVEGELQQKVKWGYDAKEVTAIANEGYEFKSWSDGKTSKTRIDYYVTKDLTIKAIFAKKVYTVTYRMASSGGTLHWDGPQEYEGWVVQHVEHMGSSKPVTVIPDERFTFIKWSDGYEQPTRYDKNIQSDMVIYAYVEIRSTYQYAVYHNKGGKISGAAIQSVPSNSYGTPVTAVADEGYTFVGWSDLLSEAIRQDGPTPNAHVQNINQVAIFEKNQKTLHYNYCGATGNQTEEYITLSRENPYDKPFVIPTKEGYEFKGWYLDEAYTRKVADENGLLFLNHIIFTCEETEIYARWDSIENPSVSYKIHFAVLNQLDIDLLQRDGTAYQECKGEMAAVEREICYILVQKAEQLLEEWFENRIDFEIDLYFTRNVIKNESVRYGGDMDTYIFSNKVPELVQFQERYDCLFVYFPTLPVVNPYLRHYLEIPIVYSSATYRQAAMQSFPIVAAHGEKLLDYNSIWYESPLATFTHEFTHTIEGGYFHALGMMDLHFCLDYYHNKMEYLDIIKLCLLGGAVVDGKRCVIPENHWESYYK